MTSSQPGLDDLKHEALALFNPHAGNPAPSTVDYLAFMARTDHSTVTETINEPTSYKVAMGCLDHEKWRAAIRSEHASLDKCGTWEITKLPPDRAAIGSKYVFKIKHDEHGNISKYKARLVARGDRQKYGVDFNETWSPVVRVACIRLLSALSTQHGFELDQMDVKSAYLNGDLDEEIYMELPEGYGTPEMRAQGMVCKLKKSLYGLKQAGRAWHAKIDTSLKKQGFTALDGDQCLYTRTREGVIIYLALYVDDLLIACNDRKALDIFKSELTKQYEMEDMGPASFILGMKIERNLAERTMTISQPAYINAIVAKHEMPNRHSATTPWDEETFKKILKLEPDVKHGASENDIKAYQSVIGELMYAMLCTRPDIAHCVSFLSRASSNPHALHFEAVQHLLRYLVGTASLGITYKAEGDAGQSAKLTGKYEIFYQGRKEQEKEAHPVGYSDANWGSDVARRSTTGYVFLLCGGPISWSSKKQSSVASSTVEAEYIALAETTKEALWWRIIFSGIGYNTNDATLILADNQGAIALAKNPTHHNGTKHIAIRYHFTREHVNNKNIKLSYIPTIDMAADILTKPLARIAHQRALGMLGMRD